METENNKIKLGELVVYDDTEFEMESVFSFSEEDFELIKKGYARRPSMDYRWYIECENDVVYILRSWNPFVNFKIPFKKVGERYKSETSRSIFNPQKKDFNSTIRTQNYWNFWIYALITKLIFNEGSIMSFDSLVYKSKTDFNSIHGFTHWRTVYDNGRMLSDEVDKRVLFYFSTFHDFFRENDNTDKSHGTKALQAIPFIRDNLKMWKTNSDDGKDIEKQLAQLSFALQYHDVSPDEWDAIDSTLKDDKTVGICLDSDRLDLGRVGVKPDEGYLLTSEAKDYLRNSYL